MISRFTSLIRLDYAVAAGATTQAFLEGILDRQILGKRCTVCAKVYVPPRGACPTCAVPLGETVTLAQEGVVTTFCTVNFPFEGQVLEPPYACAHVMLDGADVPLLHLVGGCPADQVHMGMRVKAVWAEELQPTLASIRYFAPVETP